LFGLFDVRLRVFSPDAEMACGASARNSPILFLMSAPPTRPIILFGLLDVRLRFFFPDAACGVSTRRDSPIFPMNAPPRQRGAKPDFTGAAKPAPIRL
jgi:hypothetical protein